MSILPVIASIIHINPLTHPIYGVFFLVCFSLTHQVQFVLPVYSSVWNHLWECTQSPWGHSLKETWVSLTHPSAIWSPISTMPKFYHVFSFIVLVLGVTTAVNFPLPVLILLEAPAASDLQFFQQPLSRQHLSVAGRGCDAEVLLGSEHSGVSSYLDLDSLEECWVIH